VFIVYQLPPQLFIKKGNGSIFLIGREIELQIWRSYAKLVKLDVCGLI